MSVTQHISVTISLTGEQPTRLDTHGSGEHTSYLTLTTQQVIIWLHDRRAVDSYATAWLDGVAAECSRYLRPTAVTEPAARSDFYPAIGVHAQGADQTRGGFDPHRRELSIRIGYITWVVRDAAAYQSMAATWHRIVGMEAYVFPYPG